MDFFLTIKMVKEREIKHLSLSNKKGVLFFSILLFCTSEISYNK